MTARSLREIAEDLAQIRRDLLAVERSVQIVQSHVVDRERDSGTVKWETFSTSVPVPGCTPEIAAQWNEAMEKRKIECERQMEETLIATIEAGNAKPFGLEISALTVDGSEVGQRIEEVEK